MPDVAHASLTGANLHEPKGVAGASAGEVYVADGGGSGAWDTLGASSIAATANPFGAALYYCRDEKSSGSDGGTFSSGAWQTRTLNTEVIDQLTLTLSSNRLSLAAGTYICQADAPAYGVDDHQVRLYNFSDSTVIALGTSEHATAISGSAYVMNRSFVFARFVLAGTKSIELQHRCSSSKSTNGFGNSHSFGTNVYAQLWLWKVA